MYANVSANILNIPCIKYLYKFVTSSRLLEFLQVLQILLKYTSYCYS